MKQMTDPFLEAVTWADVDKDAPPDDVLRQIAEKNPPPQEWYEEEMK